ncbi:ATP synthase subunit g, mitochondrial-like [Ostrinia furnacalis]|uniref:ATP synthase subunit g, mitochondrial-like n=1 Tax=Ostrinia furnacalis TaxID=93504 RepID=UPI00103DC480|nr:ATP synthase subunit g, mitochondrial-like [Ostrinia furnacalis]
MASGAKTLRLVNSLIRSRLAMVNELSEVYKPSITRNKEKLIELIKEKAAQARQSEIAKKLKVAKGYYTLEMAPPSGNEMQKLQSDLALVKEFFQSGCFKYLTVKQAWLLILVGTEIGLWFFLGETIGKMHIVGYKV